MDYDNDDMYGSEDENDDYYPDQDDEEEDEDESEGQKDYSEDEPEDDDEWESAEDWKAPTELPDATWKSIASQVDKLAIHNRTELTVLLLGTPGTGCSSTANSMLAETRADVRPFIGPGAAQRPEVHTRRLESYGFLLRIIDCPLLCTSGSLNLEALQDIAALPAASAVDVVLYVARLDVFRVQPLERQLMSAISGHFGKDVWKRTVLCLTRGGITPPPPHTLPDLAARRAEQLGGCLRKAGAPAGLPYTLVENSSRCPTSSDGQKQLRDGTKWVPALWEAVVARAVAAGPPKALRFAPQNPNRRRLWLVPLLVAAQYTLKVFVFDRVVEEDSWRGDKNGEYDAETQREHKMLADTRRRQAEEETKLRRQVEARSRARAEAARGAMSSADRESGFVPYVADDDDGDDYEDDED
eukprot:jgi/Ulvmu1/5766/UM025_0020.1